MIDVPISWHDFPLHKFRKEQVEVVDDGREFPPHAVLKLHGLPGLGSKSVLFCWSKENMGSGIGINEKTFEKYRISGYDPWVYLLGLRWKPGRRMSVKEQLDVIITYLGGERPRPHHPIQGRLISLEEIELFLPRAVKMGNKLKHALGPTMKFADPEHFDPQPSNSKMSPWI